jgi:hypothetical protein
LGVVEIVLLKISSIKLKEEGRIADKLSTERTTS